MIALLLAIAAAAVPATEGSSDITVAHARLQKLRLQVDTGADGRITQCRASISSGDATFDASACEATKACAAEGTNTGEAMADCVDRRLIALVEAGRKDQETKNEHDAHD